MKLLNLKLMMLLAISAMVMSSCGDDDTPEETPSSPNVGSYTLSKATKDILKNWGYEIKS